MDGLKKKQNKTSPKTCNYSWVLNRLEASGGKRTNRAGVDRRALQNPHASYRWVGWVGWVGGWGGWGGSHPAVIVGRSSPLFGGEGQLVTHARMLHQTALTSHFHCRLWPGRPGRRPHLFPSKCQDAQIESKGGRAVCSGQQGDESFISGKSPFIVLVWVLITSQAGCSFFPMKRIN